MIEFVVVFVVAYWLGFATSACFAARKRDDND